ncbi:MAG: response regulator [Deltaproteobacteria bacterium]|nr:response regulator [Deltaproteobacteria bacterium]
MTKIETILVVDDEKNTCSGLKTLLGREGYCVECVHNGQEGLKYLEKNPAQLIISDIRMPEMDGISFIHCLKERHPDVQVIVMTAFGGLDSYIEAMRNGAVEYIIKPFKMNDLKRIIERLEAESAA